VTSGEQPATIHDFRGFPQQLYDIAYPAPGSPWLAAKVSALLGEDRVLHDPNRGFDHGVWGVLRPVFPDAEIPVAAMSLDRALPPDQHLAIGRALAPLREEGVMIVGSGNVVHNLAHWGASQGTRPEWAVQFQARTNAAMSAGDDSALFRLPADDRAAALAINSGEHYLPLLYVAGARLPGDQVTVFNDTIDGSLSMTSYLVGEPVPPG
jgi:4,5-DOPA dioxygenase extradiol